ncbi:hypothetical protein Y032_0319g2372 [Ancylostoma ceylanicum]|uniref:Uncharacterized protein n=1 Tax=Ancylostoma ceylanicum TaxID=53326 RepID=A0A016S1D0_9BILA|nr:hypothetical protein Y032_0319g2372 [Ancylostoma ceylanicum]
MGCPSEKLVEQVKQIVEKVNEKEKEIEKLTKQIEQRDKQIQALASRIEEFGQPSTANSVDAEYNGESIAYSDEKWMRLSSRYSVICKSATITGQVNLKCLEAVDPHVLLAIARRKLQHDERAVFVGHSYDLCIVW